MKGAHRDNMHKMTTERKLALLRQRGGVDIFIFVIII